MAAEVFMIVKSRVFFTPTRGTRGLHVWLPDGYDESDERYLVMYMFDGHNLFYDSDATYGTCWGLREFLSGWEKQMIVVGLECSHKGNSRLIEYCPYDFNNGATHGTGQETIRWMVDELKPMIDSTYRTWPHREATGIGGSSMGGLMALYGVCAENATFSKAACLSTAFGFCYGAMKNMVQNARLDPDTRVYLGWGGREGWNAKGRAIMNNENKAINDIVWKKGAMPYLFRQDDGGHCEADWRRQVPLFMNWLWC